jgi:type II secretory pathway pseudopilin PulG
MKRCPTCSRTFAESNLTFCTEDGTPLINVDADDGEATIVSASAAHESGPESGASEGWSTTQSDRNAPAYRPPGQFPPPPPAPERTAWPWVLGTVAVILLALIGLGIAAAIFVPDMMKARRARNENSSTVSANTRANENSDANSNTNANSNVGNENKNKNANTNSAVNTPPPENQEAVLAELRNIENDWTVANLNADKQKLEWILADDYVGIQDGVMQGKAEYLRDIKPDSEIQHWDFRNLRLVLNGNRATLTGIVRFASADQDHELLLNFSDKFVWRDGRWQAVASEVTPVK